MKIEILDEINIRLSYVPDDIFYGLRDNFKIKKKDAFMTAGYKLGIDDGYERLIDDEGFTYFVLIEKIIDYLEDQGFDVDGIELVDERLELPDLPDPHVPVDINKAETGFDLRPEQVEGAEAALRHRRGVLEFATNIGKTQTCVAISKKLDGILKTVIIIPSEQLCRQTKADYEAGGLDVGFLSSKTPKKKRQEFVENHKHIIITTKMFLNCNEYFDEFECALIVDECHTFGEVFEEILRFDFANTPFCVGMTGTLPTDKLKHFKITATLGPLIGKVDTHTTIKKGYSAKPFITMVTVKHPKIEEMFNTMDTGDEYSTFDWSVENEYYNTNLERALAISNFVSSLPPKNTLVLSYAEFGNVMAAINGRPYIDRNTSVDDREKMFSQFRDPKANCTIFASYGTSSTGISENNIFRLVLIEAGKDRKTVIQSIGRGIRLDGEVNEVEVIDIGSNTKYAKKHRRERLKIYKKEKHQIVGEKELTIMGGVE